MQWNQRFIRLYDKIIITIVPSYTGKKIYHSFVGIGHCYSLLHTRNNTDGNKCVIFSGIALYYGDTYNHVVYLLYVPTSHWDIFLYHLLCVYTDHCGEPATREWLLPHCGNKVSPWKQSIIMGTKGHHENKVICTVIWYMCTQIFNTKLNQAYIYIFILKNKYIQMKLFFFFCQLESFGEFN